MICQVCQCSDMAPCPGGCAWVTPGVCSTHLPNAEVLATTAMALDVTALELLALHGQLCLALRHPGNTGASRAVAEAWVESIEALLVDAGALTPALVTVIHQVEADAQPRVILARG